MNILILFFLITSSVWAQLGSDSIPYPFYENQTESPNQLTVIYRGESALQKRIDLIRKAKKTIEVEYYIYKTDIAGKILTRELVAASQRGVRVRILVDRLMAVKNLHSYYAKELAQHGIEVKYYNTAFILKISSIHYRNHRKLIVIDDEEAITGGRNIGNDYFSLSKKYNFEDTDVIVKGPIVKTMRESFDAYYTSKIAKTADFPKPKNISYRDRHRVNHSNRIYEQKTKKAKEFLEETEEELEIRRQIAEVSALQLLNTRSHTCTNTTFATDAPGGNFITSHSRGYKEKYRHLMKVLQEKMSAVDKELTMSSPYFMANKRNKKLLRGLLEKNVKVNLYTNSLKSADKIFMAAGFYMKLRGWLNRGLNVFLNDGRWSEMSFIRPEAMDTRWGMHSKTHVYETNEYTEVMIGTYNMDNRSDYYNNEMAIFCKGNNELSQELKGDIMNLGSKGITIGADHKGTDRFGNRVNITGSSSLSKLKMKAVSLPTWLFEPLL